MNTLSRTRTSLVVDCLLLFLLAGALVKPLFEAKYLNRWDSIESTFIADGRFLHEHLPHPNWQPLWYCGTRFDYIYPPALRYGTALLSSIWAPVKAYHIYTAFFYCLGIAGVYFFIRLAQGSRGAAWLGAVAAALVSPSVLFLPPLRYDALWHTPIRLWVLTRYGEGPHMTAFALLPIALAFAFRALPKHRPASLACAALCSALVVSNNFYGATALAIFFPILVWSVWVTHRDKAVWLRAAVIAALAYGLTAFWLVPSYFQVTAENLKLVAQPATPGSFWIAAVTAAVFALVTYRLARGRHERTYPVFISGSLLFFGLNVLGNYYFNFRVAGEPHRLVPELDLAIILVAVELLRRLWNWKIAPPPNFRSFGKVAPRALAAVVVLVSLAPARHYVKHAWDLFPRDWNYQNRVEYRLTDWIAGNLPQSRTFVAGSIRFWYDAWHDLAQVSGGSDQGLLNGMVEPAQWQILTGDRGETSVQWLLCLGADAIVVTDRNSKEMFHDFLFPRKFADILPVLYDDHAGDVIYRVPRRFPGLARVIDTSRARSLHSIRFGDDMENLRAYADLVERGPDSPATSTWNGSDSLRIRAHLIPGESLLVQETYDPAWRAWANGKLLPIRKDIMGFMLIDAPPGDLDVTMQFSLPLENLIGRIVTALSLCIVAVLLVAGSRSRD